MENHSLMDHASLLCKVVLLTDHLLMETELALLATYLVTSRPRQILKGNVSARLDMNSRIKTVNRYAVMEY